MAARRLVASPAAVQPGTQPGRNRVPDPEGSILCQPGLCHRQCGEGAGQRCLVRLHGSARSDQIARHACMGAPDIQMRSRKCQSKQRTHMRDYFRALVLQETYGGWGGIRTHETRKRLLVFKTSAFNHSATHPERLLPLGNRRKRFKGLVGTWPPSGWGMRLYDRCERRQGVHNILPENPRVLTVCCDTRRGQVICSENSSWGR